VAWQPLCEFNIHAGCPGEPARFSSSPTSSTSALISGAIAKDVMHVHMTIFWTLVLGIIGGIIGGSVTHMLSRPTNQRYHPAGLIFSTLGAILVLLHLL
jgi:uncharacterized membrane protein YeaQ/YmgE (transglycosylase-associated protein family)